ncbi:glutamate-5-semialdehyde dehydrogenase [Candidatus Woesearchaeota archaeon]|nr:glutamate-5-semialdehyde dehydrogenase [Candidatus Woesearchaeota archaeon]
MTATKQAKEANQAAIKLASAETKAKNEALKRIANALKKNKKKIISENKKDLAYAEKINLKNSLIKRLKVDGSKLKEMFENVKSVAKLEDPVGKTLSAIELDKGLELYKVSCPIGVIGIIFESRPDALVQISSLCLKSGNAVILKGGSEAKNTNRILFNIIKKETERLVPKGWIQLIETREAVKETLKLDDYIDLLVPRGSNKFVKYIQDNTRIPVLGHASGICHVYVDKDADMNKAMKIAFDAKCQYPAVCNAMETLLVHKAIAKKFLDKMVRKYFNAGVELRLDEKSSKIIKIENDLTKKATEKDWETEYNDMILSVKVVNDLNEAINHINRYGSRHTDAIITKNKKTAKRFMDLVDSSSVMVNCSTRFSDGYRYGLGAEVGISTNKIHARGPVGLEGLMIYKYKLLGKGHIVADYSGKKRFTHKKLKKRC